MSVSETNGECAFSFTKKPIETTLPVHSTISDILDSSSSTRRTPSSDSIGANVPNKLNINVNSKNTINEPKDFKKTNNINHDEQIRAPRFNFFNQVNLSGENVHRSLSFSYHEDGKKDDDKKQDSEPQSVYVPANFDLNNYTYATSVSEDTTGDTSESANLSEAIHNLNENLTTFEREDHETSIQGGPDAKFQDQNKKFIKPVYKYKRPLSVPAVLRPPEPDPISSCSSSIASSRDSLSSSTSNYRFDLDNLNQKDTIDLLLNFESLEQKIEPIEPTRVHWKPNKFTNCCMKCFKTFGNFFNVTRRHHCRFCGFLICPDCLFERNTPNHQIPLHVNAMAAAQTSGSASDSSDVADDTNPLKNVTSTEGESYFIAPNVNLIYLDSKARFIIPIFRNLNFLNMDIDSLNKIFKLSKICKNCGEYYLNLLLNLNNLNVKNPAELDSELSRNLNQLKLPFVIIENPFINKKMNKNGSAHRKESFVNSTDWTWSSF